MTFYKITEQAEVSTRDGGIAERHQEYVLNIEAIAWIEKIENEEGTFTYSLVWRDGASLPINAETYDHLMEKLLR